MIKYAKMSLDVQKCYQMWKTVEKCYQMWETVEKCYQMYQNPPHHRNPLLNPSGKTRTVHCGTEPQSNHCDQTCQNVADQCHHCEQLRPDRKFTKHKLGHKESGLGRKTFMEKMMEI